MKVGLCYRDSIHEPYIQDLIKYIDVLELMPDVTRFRETNFLMELCKQNNVDIGIHCLRSSLGSKEGFFVPAIEQYAIYNEYVNSIYYSDHAAFSHLHGKYLSSVNAIDFSNKSAQLMANNINNLSTYFSTDILIENITQNNLSKNNRISESAFFRKVMELTNSKAKIMFDVTNAYVTALNNNIPFERYIEDFPFEDIVCLHVSGYERYGNGLLRDSHSRDLDSTILEATNYVINNSKPDMILLERDFNVTSLGDTLRDLEKIRENSTYRKAVF